MVGSLFLGRKKKRNFSLGRVLSFRKKKKRNMKARVNDFTRSFSKNVTILYTMTGKKVAVFSKDFNKWYRKSRKKMVRSAWYKDWKKGRFFSKRLNKAQKWTSEQTSKVTRPVAIAYANISKGISKKYPKVKKSFNTTLGNFSLARVA
ncbi:MAG: hypothetical protein ACK4ND_04070 [Cytophagaceae bacterium]